MTAPTTTQSTAEATKAANALCNEFWTERRRRYARIIDRETGLPALLAEQDRLRRACKVAAEELEAYDPEQSSIAFSVHTLRTALADTEGATQ